MKKEVTDAPILPVSQTHRVVTVAADIRSSHEQYMERRQDRIKEIETELLEESLEVISGAMQFADIDPTLDEPDAEFLEKYKDHADPVKLFRLMKYGQLPAAKAPSGLQLAQKTAIGILKARATERGDIRPLQVNVQVVQSAPVFEKVYESDDGGDK